MDKILYEIKGECGMEDTQYIHLCKHNSGTILNVMNRSGTLQIYSDVACSPSIRTINNGN